MKHYIAFLPCLVLLGCTMCFCQGNEEVSPDEPIIIIPDNPDEPDNPDNPDEPKEYNNLGFTVHKDGEPYNTYKGLVMAGYQGWFCTPDSDCSHNSYYHYQGNNGRFLPGVLKNTIDYWPDMSEYDKTYETAFTLPDGKTARVYSAYDESSVMLHFKWMKDYGIDGVFMQRFLAEVIGNPRGIDHFNKVLDNAMKASNQYQRAICVMYDLSGGKKEIADIVADAKSIWDKYQLGDRSVQKYYLYENGKPLIALWGMGFIDRPYSCDEVEQMMDGLKEIGYSVMLGVPSHWRSLSGDCVSDEKVQELIKKSDAFFPWYVARFTNGDGNYGVDAWASNVASEDIQWAKTNNLVFAPLCFPGFSWTHMNPESDNSNYGRQRGQFLWKQAYNYVRAGAQCIYIAMFDEIDEGTAIYKVLNNKDVPSNDPSPDYYVYYNGSSCSISYMMKIGMQPGQWCKKASELGIPFMGIDDDLPTDHYLWLTGQIGKMLRGEIPMTASMPSR